MDIKIIGYGISNDTCFILYNVGGLTPDQLEFLNNNLDDETQINNGDLILKTKFEKKVFPI